MLEAARLLGQRVEQASTDGASDAGYVVAQMGVPVVDGLGPWGRGIHAEGEAVAVSGLSDRGTLLATNFVLLAKVLARDGN